MANITSFKDVRLQVENVYNYKVKAGETIPEGALVGLDVDGLAVNAVAAKRIVGVANGDFSKDEKGDLVVHVDTHGIITLQTSATITQASVGSPVQVVDNQTVAVATTGVKVGEIVKRIDANTARVRLHVFPIA